MNFVIIIIFIFYFFNYHKSTAVHKSSTAKRKEILGKSHNENHACHKHSKDTFITTVPKSLMQKEQQ